MGRRPRRNRAESVFFVFSHDAAHSRIGRVGCCRGSSKEGFSAMRKFLVTGGAGFIGSHIAEALVERGETVRVLDNLSTGNVENLAAFREQLDFVKGDLLDAELLREMVEGVDCIFHEAALASVPRSVEAPLDTNAACVTGTVALLDAARKAGVRRVVYAASSSAYGDQPTSSKRETDLPAPISPYGAAKLAAEYYCQAFWATYGLETVAIRYFNVFGPRQDPGSPYSAVIPLFITAMLQGRRPVVYGDGRQSRDFTYVANVVQANLLAADAAGVAGQTLNAANGRSTDLRTLIGALNELLGTDVQPIHEPPRPGDVRESLADITRARKLLGYEPQIGFEEGLRRSIDYYRSLVG
jgi:UDP-glucose 4-epimerase